MSFSPFGKTPMFLTGVGVSGSGAIGIGGGQFVEGAYPTGHKRLSNQGFKGNPAVPKLNSDVSSSIYSTSDGENKYQLKSYGCFQNFFPGATVNQSWVKDDTTFQDTLNSSSYSVSDSSQNPIGCALMDLSYDLSHEGSNTAQYIFKAEITVKNDRFGGVLWAGSKRTYKPASSGDSGNNGVYGDTSYYLLFLKKDDSKDNGSIIGGYSGSDAGASSTGYALSSFHLSAPGGEDWAQAIKDHETQNNKQFKSYAGFGEGSEVGKEIFQDIEIGHDGSNDRSQSAEILGRELKSGSNEIDFQKTPGPEISATYGYDGSRGWVEFSNCSSGKDVGSILNAFYTPGKGKKGVWSEIKDYCKNNSSRRGISSSELEKLKNLCYSK